MNGEGTLEVEEEEEFFESGSTEQKTETEEVIESEVCVEYSEFLNL